MSRRAGPKARIVRLLPAPGDLLLVAAAIFVSALLAEIGVRVAAHMKNRGLLDSALARGVEIPADRRAELGHIIRRSPDPKIVYELKPGLSVIYRDAPLTTDERGFRIAETHEPETIDSGTIGNPSIDAGTLGDQTAGAGRLDDRDIDDVFRVVGIGDSNMFGHGVAAARTYLAMLEARLGERCAGRTFRAVNTAVPGYNTVMEVATLKSKGVGLRPDLVIIEFVGNDLSLPNFVSEPARPWSLRRSFLGDFLKERLDLRRDTTLWRRLLDAGLRGVPQDDPAASGSTTDPAAVSPELRGLVGWDAYAAAIDQLRSLSVSRGFNVLSISLDPEESALAGRVLALSRASGFHVLDVGEQFREYLESAGFGRYLESPLALAPADRHPSALGHEIAAAALARFIGEQILGPSTPPGGDTDTAFPCAAL